MQIYLVYYGKNLETAWDTWAAAKAEVMTRLKFEGMEKRHWFDIREMRLNQGYLWDKRDSLETGEKS